MKEIIPKIFKLETPKERENFFDNLFTTDLFRELLNKKHFVLESIKSNYIKYPRYFYKMQDKDLERAAFTSWYNVLSLKEYSNKYIQDLYYFHELSHIATMTYEPHLSFNDWSEKMRSNEVLASLNSEVLIYFFSPEYRKYTFPEEIWVDRFLQKTYYRELGKNDYSRLAIELTIKRMQAYEKPQDKVEQVLADFRQFSHLYYNVWKDKYQELETVLRNFYSGKETEYEKFLKDNQSSNGILFEDKVREHQNNYITRNKSRPHY